VSQSEGHEGLESSHYGGVQVPVVPGKVLHGLELDEITHQVHRTPDVRVACVCVCVCSV